MRFASILISALAALLLSACGEQGKYYEQTPDAIRSALQSATLPYHILGSQAKGTRVIKIDDTKTAVAVVGPNDSEMMRFVTTVTPDGTGSRVMVELAPPEGRNKEKAEKAMQSNAMAMMLMKKLADEHVAAAIEHRPFDMMFATPALAKGMIGASPELRAQLDEANRSAASMNEAARRYEEDEKQRAAAAADEEYEREQREKLVANEVKSY
jgi:hypothetical protein